MRLSTLGFWVIGTVLVLQLAFACALWQKVDSSLSAQQVSVSSQHDNDDYLAGDLKGLIVFSGLTNVLVAVVLVLLIHNRFSSRIRVILENLSRISESSNLHQQLSGKDELASIDKSVHAMALALSTKVRRHVMTQNTLKAIEDEKKEASKIRLDLTNRSLKDVILQAISRVEEQAESKGIEIVTDLENVIVCFDEDRIHEVLVSLLSNAVKYAPQGEPINVLLGKVPYSIVVTIVDQGPGISYDQQDTIFDITGKITGPRAKDFTGLELVQCKAIITAHGGTIGVDSEEGEGSSFWFTLPYFEMDTLSE